MKMLFLICFLLLVFVSVLQAESDKAYFCQYMESYPQSVRQAAQAPLNWQNPDWLKAGAIIVSAGALYLADEAIRDFAQEQRNDFSASISLAAKQFGEGRLILPAIGLSIAGGYVMNSPKTMDTGLLCLKSFVLSQAVTQSLKLATQRFRPSAEKGKEFWAENGISRRRDSFPSGHSTIAWSLAPVIAGQYGDHSWVAPAAYTIASLTSLSRVHDNNHWASDVFVGAVIGYYSASLTLNSTPRLMLMPDPALQGIGFSFDF